MVCWKITHSCDSFPSSTPSSSQLVLWRSSRIFSICSYEFPIFFQWFPHISHMICSVYCGVTLFGVSSRPILPYVARSRSKWREPKVSQLSSRKRWWPVDVVPTVPTLDFFRRNIRWSKRISSYSKSYLTQNMVVEECLNQLKPQQRPLDFSKC